MTGLDIYNLKQTAFQSFEDLGMIIEDKRIIYSCITSQGDKIKMIFTSPKREKYAKAAEKIWKTITEYSLLPENQVYLIPKIYWTIYKYTAGGKELLKGVGNQLFINDIKYSFVSPQYYFTPHQGNLKGVYGIYYQNQLLYIGSSTDCIARFKEHDDNFRNHNNFNKMYSVGYNPDEIEYKVLFSEEDLTNLSSIETPSQWLFELIELSYIHLLQPLYNVEGKNKVFSFQASSTDLPYDYYSLVKMFLQDDHYQAKELLKKGLQ